MTRRAARRDEKSGNCVWVVFSHRTSQRRSDDPSSLVTSHRRVAELKTVAGADWARPWRRRRRRWRDRRADVAMDARASRSDAAVRRALGAGGCGGGADAAVSRRSKRARGRRLTASTIPSAVSTSRYRRYRPGAADPREAIARSRSWCSAMIGAPTGRRPERNWRSAKSNAAFILPRLHRFAECRGEHGGRRRWRTSRRAARHGREVLPAGGRSAQRRRETCADAAARLRDEVEARRGAPAEAREAAEAPGRAASRDNARVCRERATRRTSPARGARVGPVAGKGWSQQCDEEDDCGPSSVARYHAHRQT